MSIFAGLAFEIKQSTSQMQEIQNETWKKQQLE